MRISRIDMHEAMEKDKMDARKCALCWAHDGTHNPDCLACEGTGYRPMGDPSTDEVKVRENGTGFIAYFANRPINGPYGAGNTPEEARASLAEWTANGVTR